MGAFAEWQPRYAERGVPTFPVDMAEGRKKPRVSGYLRLGSKVSDQLAIRFPDSDAFGFAVRRARVTVLDVDTADERVLADALGRYGPTPIIVRSGSGNSQAWYRHAGEARRIRPDPSCPIDVLGDGFIVAPPSIGVSGAYQFIQGSLDDLPNLPRTIEASPNVPVQPSKLSHEPPTKIAVGKRGDTLWRWCMFAVRRSANISELQEAAMRHNAEVFYELLPADEVLAIVASAMKYEAEGKNWIGVGAHVVLDHQVVDELASGEPHAFALLGILRRHHWGREFALAKAFAKHLGWTLPAFRSARAVLLNHGLIECVHPGGQGPKDPAVYRFAKGYENAPQ